jgi:hypothetical protein
MIDEETRMIKTPCKYPHKDKYKPKRVSFLEEAVVLFFFVHQSVAHYYDKWNREDRVKL